MQQPSSREPHQHSSQSIRIKNYNYGGEQHTASIPQLTRATSNEHIPIRVVVDMIGEDGNIHQQIINSTCELQQQHTKPTPQKYNQNTPKQRVSLPTHTISPTKSK